MEAILQARLMGRTHAHAYLWNRRHASAQSQKAAVLLRRSGRRPRFGCGMVSTVTSVEATAPVDVADIRARCAKIKSHIPVPATLHDLNQKVRAADAAQAPSIMTLSCMEVSDQTRGRRCT